MNSENPLDIRAAALYNRGSKIGMDFSEMQCSFFAIHHVRCVAFFVLHTPRDHTTERNKKQ